MRWYLIYRHEDLVSFRMNTIVEDEEKKEISHLYVGDSLYYNPCSEREYGASLTISFGYSMGFFWKKMANGPHFYHSISNSIFTLEWFTTADVKSRSIAQIRVTLFNELMCPSLFIYWLMMTYFCAFNGTYIHTIHTVL